MSHLARVNEALREFGNEHSLPNRVSARELSAYYTRLSPTQVRRIGRKHTGHTVMTHRFTWHYAQGEFSVDPFPETT